MNKLIILLVILILDLNSFSQGILLNDIKAIKGIWIAEDFYNSFEKNKSHIKSANSFEHDYPVGLRINDYEINDSMINIGYSVLHDHCQHIETSNFTIIDNDTIYEQGSFNLKLNYKDSSGYYLIYNLWNNFNYGFEAYLKWEISSNDTLVVMQRRLNNGIRRESIKFKRLTSNFSKDNLFPNPIYYYMRLRMLEGKYILKDKNDSILSSNFIIYLNGRTKGYPPLGEKVFYYSTDNYCLHPDGDNVLLCDLIKKRYSFNCSGYIYKRTSDNSVLLYKTWFDEKTCEYKNGNLVYKLIKK